MRRLLSILLVGLVLACSNTDDDNSNGDIPADGVNFDIAVITQDPNGDYLQIDIEKGLNLTGITNLSNEMNLDENNIAYNIEGEYVVFYKRAQASKVWRRNTRENSYEVIQDFFSPEITPSNVLSYAGKDYFLTAYLDANALDDRYIDVYNPLNGNESTVFSINRNIQQFDVRGDRMIVLYSDETGQIVLNSFDLSIPVLSSQLLVTEYLGYTFDQRQMHLFQEENYQVFDFSSGSLGNPVSTTERIRNSSLFRSDIRGNLMGYAFPYAQPSPLVEGPAIYNLQTGTNTYYPLFDLSAQLDAMGQSLISGGAFNINVLEGVVVMAYSYIPEDSSETKHAIAFVNLDMEVISTVDLPYIPLDVILK